MARSSKWLHGGKVLEVVLVEEEPDPPVVRVPSPMDLQDAPWNPLMRIYMALEHMRLFGIEELASLKDFQDQSKLEWKHYISLTDAERTAKLFLSCIKIRSHLSSSFVMCLSAYVFVCVRLSSAPRNWMPYQPEIVMDSLLEFTKDWHQIA